MENKSEFHNPELSEQKESRKEVAVDIGGGAGEFFLKMAKENPDKHFLILEPQELSMEEKPPNLDIVQWRSEKELVLPLRENSISDAYINFLMGEIKYKGHYATTEEEAIEMYRKILSELKEVLKSGSLVHITDVRDNIKHIKKALLDEGFNITSGPARLTDENKTLWSKMFSDAFKQIGKSEDESYILPMTMEAQLLKKSEQP